MIVTGHWHDCPLNISHKTTGLAISVVDGTRTDSYSYDAAGRLWSVYLDGIAYQRGLDGRVIGRWRKPGEQRQRHWLNAEESTRIIHTAHQFVTHLLRDIDTGAVNLRGGLSEDMRHALQAAATFDVGQSQADARRCREVYQPVGILPPDQYMALVLQMTEGCSFNTCTFCNFYKDRPFRIKSPEEFEAHARAVRDFIGAGISLRRSIFLGDANALVIPQPRLMPLLDIIPRVFDMDTMNGLFAFLDGFSGEKKTPADYADLRKRHVRRVYIGLESGSADLLRVLNKPGTPDDALQAVQAMKAGGLAVGVIVLIGAGGQRYAADHVQQTIDILNAMRLTMDDLIYFSDLITTDDMPYAQQAAELGELSPEQRREQQAAIEASLVFTADDGIPHMSRYDIREFIY